MQYSLLKKTIRVNRSQVRNGYSYVIINFDLFLEKNSLVAHLQRPSSNESNNYGLFNKGASVRVFVIQLCVVVIFLYFTCEHLFDIIRYLYRNPKEVAALGSQVPLSV